MKLPSVLIIGAMKAGTTSLYMDLAHHADVFLADQKEPHFLCSDDVLTDAGKARYAALYRGAGEGQLCIDASTGYSKRPDIEGVVERALETLPSGFKVIYLVRHPVDRIISQHHHEYYEGRVSPSIDETVRTHDRYLSYSRYGYQLQPWIEAIGRERVHVVFFEQFVTERSKTLDEVCRFLGLSSIGSSVDEATIYNRSQGKPVKTGAWQAVRGSALYQRCVRPLLPVHVRLRVRELFLPKARRQLAPPSGETIKFICDELRDDVEQFCRSQGLESIPWSGFRTAD